MTKRLVGGVVRAGRAAVSVVGLAVVLALVLGAATAAMGATGGNFILGQANAASTASKLTASIAGPALTLVNNSTNAAATALNVSVASGKAPIKVNAEAGTATGLSADELDGMDSAQFVRLGGFKATEVIDTFGPLPREGTFTTNGGTLLISASGSGYRSSTDTTSDAGRIGMRVMIDGQFHEGIETYTNDADSHKAFVSNNFVVTNLAAGTHKITLERGWDSQLCGTQDEHEFLPCTTTDVGDNFYVSVLEIPK